MSEVQESNRDQGGLRPLEEITPPEIYQELRKGVLGQDAALRYVSVAVYKHTTGKVTGNILLIGNSGTGKTHVATAIGLTACNEGRKVRFFGVTSLVTGLLEARENRGLERMLRQLSRQDLLILDELGYVPFTKVGAELLFEVVSRAYERQSLIVTTNLPFEQWCEVCGSERLTGAMLDRLTHRVHIVEANGESYRLRDSQRRMKRRRKTTAKS